MRPERRLDRYGFNAVSFLLRLLRKYNLSLFLTVTVMSCSFTVILVLTSTDPRLADYEFLPHDDSLEASITSEHARDVDNVRNTSANVLSTSNVGSTPDVRSTSNVRSKFGFHSTSDVHSTSYIRNTSNVRSTYNVRNMSNVRSTSDVRNTSKYEDARSLYEGTRVLCVVVTRRKYPSEKSPHVNATWGRRCNKLVFMKPTHTPKWTSPNESTRKQSPISSRAQNTFQYVYDHHLADADWFMKADDDTYVIVENLRYLLAGYDSTAPIFFGHRYKSGYVSAGAGYVLSRRAVELLVESGFGATGVCPDTARVEDIEVAACLEKLGVRPGDSRDSQGRDRFFPVLPEDIFFPDSENNLAWYWNASYYEKKVGLECCSDKPISFRVVEPEQMYILEYFIYHVIPHGGGHPEGRARAYPFG